MHIARERRSAIRNRPRSARTALEDQAAPAGCQGAAALMRARRRPPRRHLSFDAQRRMMVSGSRDRPRAASAGRAGRTPAAWGLAGLAVANGVAVVVLGLRPETLREVRDVAGALVLAGRVCGLLGAYLALVQLLLLARLPVLDRV